MAVAAKIAPVMSEADVEVVRRAAAAWEQGGVEAMLEFADPEIEWQSRPDLPDADLYTGHDGVRKLYDRFEEDLADTYYEPVELIDGGDRVVLVFNWGGTGRSSGIEVESRGEAWVFTVAGGKILKVDEYPSKQEALEALEA